MSRARHFRPSPRKVAGLSLIELMIALVLGLLIVAGALSVFASNKATYRATESLGRVQESTRVAFELMSREVREAGGNPCAKNLPMANVINNASTQWYYNFGNGIQGYDSGTAMPGVTTGTAAGNRIAATDAIQLMSAQSSGATIVSHNPTSAQFKLNTVDHDLNDGDLAIVCDFREVAMLQVTNAQPGINDTVVHNPKASGNPGNCTKGLGIPPKCTTNGTPYTFGPNSTVAKLKQTQWYVGANANGGRSLYQIVVQNVGAVPTPSAPQEITENVDDMQIRYLLPGSSTFVTAATVNAAGRWAEVQAVQLNITLKGVDKVGTDASQVSRTLRHIVSLRNRSE